MMFPLHAPPFQLRDAGDADLAFLLQLYAATRAEELAAVPWAGEQKAMFLRLQFDARRRAYEGAYPGATDQVVVVDGARAGRLLVHRGPAVLRIVDLALLPEHRGAGLGSALLQGVLREAAESGRDVQLHVERSNPARRLYERLGFEARGDLAGIYQPMTWRAHSPA